MDSAPTTFKLRHILPNARSFNTKDIAFNRLTTVASECLPGDLYAALITANGDGHDEVEIAFKNGAVGILAERLLPIQHPLVLVDDTRTAVSVINQAIHNTPSSALKTIAVTGTSGINAASHLLCHVLTECGMAAAQIGSDQPNCERQFTDNLTGPLSELAKSNLDVAIVQLPANQLATRLYDHLQFDNLVITCIETEAEDFEGTPLAFENSFQRAFERLKPEHPAVLNLADPITRFEFLPENRPFLSIGPNDEADIFAQHIEHGRSGQTFRVHAGEHTREIFSPIHGHQHIYQCLQAIAIGLLQNLPFNSLCKAIESYEVAPGQLERIEAGQPFDVFIDHADTAKDLSKAIRSLRQVTEGRLIVVYGPSATNDAASRAAMGGVAEKFADVSVITENNPEYEHPLTIAHDVLDGYSRSADAYVIPGRERAIVWALTAARIEDTVLIAGKGRNNTHLLGSESLYFDDAEIASICLQELANPRPKYGRDVFRIEEYRD